MLIPDIEKLVSDHLRSELSIRVVGEPPSERTDPWVMVTMLTALQNDQADHHCEFYLQFDVYAGAEGGQPEANLLGRQVRSALQSLSGRVDYTVQGEPQAAVVSQPVIDGDTRIPDDDFEPARERRILSVTTWAHSVAP